MLELLDLTQTLPKSEYAAVMPALRAELRDLQQAILAAGIPVVVLLEGWDAAGKGDSIGTLVYPLDPRGFRVCTTHAPTEEDHLRPYLWRFWIRLPARGKFAFFDRGWHRRMLEARFDGGLDRQGLMVAAGEIREFERQLTDDGAVLVKFWLQISKKEQKRRLADMQADRYERWRMKQPGRKRQFSYRHSVEVAEEMLALTSTANAPWTLIAAENRYFRRADILHKVVAALRHALAARNVPLSVRSSDGVPGISELRPGTDEPSSLPGLAPVSSLPTLLDRVDLTRRLDRGEYEDQLHRLQDRLRELELECYQQRVPVVVVYEGWDAAGKGGNIKRLTQELDPRGYEVIPIAAPDATEKAHHYLWRFWRQLPKAGHIAIFDRSWYGRVLVERVEGFARETEWRRAYQEINEFERHLAEGGSVLLKFWLHLSSEEQLRRFEERERVPHKRHKITPEDWRNRSQWGAYRDAVVEMIERTSTSYAPWTIVEAEDKLWARIKTLATLVKALEERLGEAGNKQ
ncbi:MAG: polyphosphate:AMP phosphotransferase [Acidobacteria bacterium]|nr:polyphosphate:AMP phosphotransferase [Acidobacteriota bacterium]